MAVYKIFPNKDATIYSQNPAQNTGRDEILEVSVKNSQDYKRYTGVVELEKTPYYNYDFAFDDYYSITSSLDNISRTLLSFSDSDLQILKNFESSSYKATLKLYLAFAQNLSQDYTIECYPAAQEWTMGTGRYSDVPYNNTGVSWMYTGQYQNSPTWSVANGSGSYLYITGGGSWNSNNGTSQSFSYTSDKDISLDLTSIVQQWFSGSTNYGVILKHNTAVEMNTGSFIDLKFYSIDTHTIYPPCIDYKWDDSNYERSTSNLTYVLDNNFVLVCENNRSDYKEGTVYSFRLKARDKYPVRQFTTSSVYLNWKYLPPQTYWSIVDLKTKEVIIDFDENYTKVSADRAGNYFAVYMNGLQPERYYKLLIKTRIYDMDTELFSQATTLAAQYALLNSFTIQQLATLPYKPVVVDNDIIFKVVR